MGNPIRTAPQGDANKFLMTNKNVEKVLKKAEEEKLAAARAEEERLRQEELARQKKK